VYIEGYNMENEVKKDLLNESGLIIIPLMIKQHLTDTKTTF